MHFIRVLNKGVGRFPALTQGQCYLFSYNIHKRVFSLIVLHEQISAGSSKSCELLLSAVSYNVCSINLFLCNLKLRHNSREGQKSWARVPSVTGLPWPAWCLPPTVWLAAAKVHGIVSNAPRLISRHCAGNCTAFNSKQQHTEHRSTSLEMQTQGECAEFATKQGHLAYSHLESLQPRTFNAFWTHFDASPQSWTNIDKNKLKSETSPKDGSYTTCLSITSFRALHTWSKIDWKAFPQGLQ